MNKPLALALTALIATQSLACDGGAKSKPAAIETKEKKSKKKERRASEKKDPYVETAVDGLSETDVKTKLRAKWRALNVVSETRNGAGWAATVELGRKRYRVILGECTSAPDCKHALDQLFKAAKPRVTSTARGDKRVVLVECVGDKPPHMGTWQPCTSGSQRQMLDALKS